MAACSRPEPRRKQEGPLYGQEAPPSFPSTAAHPFQSLTGAGWGDDRSASVPLWSLAQAAPLGVGLRLISQ